MSYVFPLAPDYQENNFFNSCGFTLMPFDDKRNPGITLYLDEIRLD